MGKSPNSLPERERQLTLLTASVHRDGAPVVGAAGKAGHCAHLRQLIDQGGSMRFVRLASAAFLLAALSTSAAAQDGASVVAAASKAMAADTLTSITYSGTARSGAFGQSKDIGEPMGPV